RLRRTSRRRPRGRRGSGDLCAAPVGAFTLPSAMSEPIPTLANSDDGSVPPRPVFAHGAGWELDHSGAADEPVRPNPESALVSTGGIGTGSARASVERADHVTPSGGPESSRYVGAEALW